MDRCAFCLVLFLVASTRSDPIAHDSLYADLDVSDSTSNNQRAREVVRDDGTIGDGGYVNIGVKGPNEEYTPLFIDIGDGHEDLEGGETIGRLLKRHKGKFIGKLHRIGDFIKSALEKGLFKHILEKFKEGPLAHILFPKKKREVDSLEAAAAEREVLEIDAGEQRSNPFYTDIKPVWPEIPNSQPIPVLAPVKTVPAPPPPKKEGGFLELFKPLGDLLRGDKKEQPDEPKWGLRFTRLFVDAIETFVKGTKKVLADFDKPKKALGFDCQL